MVMQAEVFKNLFLLDSELLERVCDDVNLWLHVIPWAGRQRVKVRSLYFPSSFAFMSRISNSFQAWELINKDFCLNCMLQISDYRAN